MSETKKSPLAQIAEMIRHRFYSQNQPATELLVTVILLWYLVEIGVLLLGWDKESIQWMFTTKSFPQLSPGLFFATISHMPPPQITHLFGNVTFLWLFAGESEQHMRQIEVIIFFTVTALVAVLAGTAIYVDSTMGASGGVMGFIGFYCVHMILKHRESFKFDVLTSEGQTDAPVRTYLGLGLVLTPVVLVLFLFGQLIGLLPTGQDDIVGHFTGLLFGIAYATGREKFRK